MGLFDYVHVDQPGFDPEEAFQTKDFDPYMHRYDITKAGRLVLTEWIFGGEQSEPKDMNFHGIMYFHTLRGDDWVQGEAKFTDGTLVSVGVTVHPPDK